MIAIDAGAEDMNSDDEEFFEIYTDYEDIFQVREKFEEDNFIVSIAERTIVPQNTIKQEGKNAEQMLKIMEMLDDHEDVQDIYANFDIDDEVMIKIAGQNTYSWNRSRNPGYRNRYN